MKSSAIKSFEEFAFLDEENSLFLSQMLNEVLITFGKEAYPKFGNVVILAGGAGSGKGFVKDKLLGIEGQTFDVDALKKLAMMAPGIIKKLKDMGREDISQLDMKNPDDVSKLHGLVGDVLQLDKKKQNMLIPRLLAGDPSRKPNLIFDVTLKDLQKFSNLTFLTNQLGYDKKNVHLVWVVNDVEVALKQNAERDMAVAPEILINTHRGVSQTMYDILNMGNTLKGYMDGVIVLAFNQAKVDSELLKSPNKPSENPVMQAKSDSKGMWITKADYVYLKKQGSPAMTVDQIADDIKKKIASYVPKGNTWE